MRGGEPVTVQVRVRGRMRLALAIAAALAIAGAGCNSGTPLVGYCDLDTQSDVLNCGACGVACDVPAHATRTCTAGVCGRTPCESGYYDLDGSQTFGCEAKCERGVCTLGDGTTVTLAEDPLPETGTVFSALSSGSSFGAALQTSTRYTHYAVLGEPTPPALGGVVMQAGATHRHQGGFSAADRQ